MGLALNEYLKRFGLRPLPVGNQGIVPGDLLRKNNEGFFKVGSAFNVLGKKADYANRLEEGNMVNGEIEETRNYGGGLKLPLIGGLELSGGLKKTKKAITAITEVKCRVFDTDNGARSAMEIEADILAFKNSDKAKWKMVNDRWFVVQCWYATKFTVTLTGNKELNAEVDVKSINVDGSANWVDKNVLEVVSNMTVPFAVNADEM